MKKLKTVILLTILTLGVESAYAQMKQQIPVLGKTYWCAKVEDILINPQNFTTADQISVGVRIKLWKQTIIPESPGIKKCACAVEPVRVGTDYWHAVMSLRLIGIKYSETETNLLEYYGATPAFAPYKYSGFSVIGFMVSNKDVEKGYIEVWGWAPKKNPLKDNREFTIYVTLDAKGYALKEDNDPDYLRKGCFPPHDGGYEGDFRKTFKPQELKVPEIKKELIEKGIKVSKSLPDLKISNAEIFPKISKRENEWAVIYDEAQLKINILNSGQADVPKFKVKVERKWQGESEYHPETGRDSRYDVGYSWSSIKDGIIEVDGIQAGGYRTILIFVDNSVEPKADCWFRITLDPDNEIAEFDETNNTFTDILFPSHYKHPEKYKKFKPAPAKAK